MSNQPTPISRCFHPGAPAPAGGPPASIAAPGRRTILITATTREASQIAAAGTLLPRSMRDPDAGPARKRRGADAGATAGAAAGKFSKQKPRAQGSSLANSWPRGLSPHEWRGELWRGKNVVPGGGKQLFAVAQTAAQLARRHA